MTKLKISAKMHIMIIVSAVVVAIGLAVGLICHFVSDGYFNYGGEYQSYQSVTVSYAILEFNGEDAVKDECEASFKKSGVSYYSYAYATTSDGGELTYKFYNNADTDKIKSAVEDINAKCHDEENNLFGLSIAAHHSVVTELGGSNVMVYGAIALAASVAFQFIYFAIRYKLTAALSALLADVHNFAIFISLLAITRAPVSSSIVAFGVITVLMTMIGCCFLFDRVRKNAKTEEFAKLDNFTQVDTCTKESFVSICTLSVCAAVAAVVFFVLMSISALSVTAIAIPVLMGLFAAAACVYGTAFFTPAVYSRIKRIGENYNQSRKTKKAKKA